MKSYAELGIFFIVVLAYPLFVLIADTSTLYVVMKKNVSGTVFSLLG